MAVPVVTVPTSRNLARVTGGSRDRYFPFIDFGLPDLAKWVDDFMGDTLNAHYQSTASGAGSVAAAIALGVNNGIVRLETGTDSGGRSDLSLGRHFRGDQNCVIAARVSLSAVTSVKMEVGFTDKVSGTDAGAVNVLATPSFNATDAAVWIMDTNDTANMKYVSVNNAVTGANASTSNAMVAATYYTFIVALRDTSARFIWVNADGNSIGGYGDSGWIASAVRSTILLTPWVFVQARTGSANRQCDIDHLTTWQRRTSTN